MCTELIKYGMDDPAIGDEYEMYRVTDVDKYVAKLKAENEKLVKCCKEYDSRQRIDERIKFSGAKQLRRLKRALWIARASMCKLEKDRWANHIDLGGRRNRKDPAYVKTGKLLTATEWRELWENNERKCRAKAEEYK